MISLLLCICAQLETDAPPTGTEISATAQPVSHQSVKIDRAMLANRRFEFSWSSGGKRAVNGIATLRDDGRIEGIRSPNESTWRVDEQGRLLFLHADGRVSTRYEKAWTENGMLHFQGPFLLREGVVHHLTETKAGRSSRTQEISAEQAAKITYSQQQFIYIDPGESYSFRLKDGTQREIQLVSVRERRDPVVGLVRDATVQIQIDGRPIELNCAPYTMPTTAHGLRILADTTDQWLDLPKRVQLSAWDATDEIVDTERFRFPLPEYDLFSHGMQAYNEPVHLGHRDGDPAGQHFYHNYGVDFAGYEGRQKVTSCIDGVVVQVDRRQGDLSVRDEHDFIVHFGHLDSIRPEIEFGTHVSAGQWVGMLGRRGASGNFSHLHVGAYLSSASLAAGESNRNLNIYPWLVAAYLDSVDDSFFAVAGPHKTALVGDRVLFDAANSIALKSKIANYEWTFHNGHSSSGSQATHEYDRAGCYTAALSCEDGQGNRDVDFCRVRVYSRSDPEPVIPTLFATRIPAYRVRVAQPLTFRAWAQGAEISDLRVDFGDGTETQDYVCYTAVEHKYRTPGIYVVSFTGQSGSLPVDQKLKVVVREQ